jgi:hypothetical protein
MRFSTVFATLLPAGAALAQTIFNVTVGANETLTFTPNSITGAQNGDKVNFLFASKNHTVTQSSFAQPCAPFTPPGATQLLDSQFQAVPQANEATGPFPVFTVTLGNLTGPLWFYCRQKTPVNHCQMGMVFAVNPTADKSFSAFQQNAMNPNATAPALPSGSSTASSPPASSGAPSSSSSGAPAQAPLTTSAPGSSDSTTPSSGSSSSPTSAAPTTSASSGASAAVHVGSAGILLGGVGLLFGLAL